MAEKMIQTSNMISATNMGHILYVYDLKDRYIENAVSYVVTALKKGEHILLIDSRVNYEQILLSLEAVVTDNLLTNLHYIDNIDFYHCCGDFQANRIIERFTNEVNYFKDRKIHIRSWANVVWENQESILSKIEDFEEKANHCVKNSDVVSVCAYNSNEITASFQNALLRSHEYFMTDYELVKSSLYRKESTIKTSLEIQNEMGNIGVKVNASEHQLKSFILHNLDPVVILDKSDKVISINDAFETTFGYTANEIVGLDVHNLPVIPSELNFEVNLNRSFAMLGEKVKGYETIRVTKDGKSLQVLLSCFPLLDKELEVTGWAVILRDISEKKQAQDLLIQSEKLSIAGELAAGIAHEIRNPITSVKGFLQLMLSSNFEKKTYYDIMLSEIERIELILSELLMLAKPQATNFALKDISKLLEDVVTLLGPQAIMNNIQIITKIDTNQTTVMCEENQLKQVSINFIKNAIEAMPNGGEILITLFSNKQNELVIRFKDQGCGIPAELITKLGQPFYTTKEKGTGLGFMVSKRIIENHNGSVDIESEVKKGTTIEVKLPILNIKTL